MFKRGKKKEAKAMWMGFKAGSPSEAEKTSEKLRKRVG